MYVDIPSDLSSSTIKMLMRDDDKCLSSSVICAALTGRRLVGRSVGRSNVPLFGLSGCLSKRLLIVLRHFTAMANIDVVLKSILGSPPYYYYYFLLLRRSEN